MFPHPLQQARDAWRAIIRDSNAARDAWRAGVSPAQFYQNQMDLLLLSRDLQQEQHAEAGAEGVAHPEMDVVRERRNRLATLRQMLNRESSQSLSQNQQASGGGGGGGGGGGTIDDDDDNGRHGDQQGEGEGGGGTIDDDDDNGRHGDQQGEGEGGGGTIDDEQLLLPRSEGWPRASSAPTLASLAMVPELPRRRSLPLAFLDDAAAPQWTWAQRFYIWAMPLRRRIDLQLQQHMLLLRQFVFWLQPTASVIWNDGRAQLLYYVFGVLVPLSYAVLQPIRYVFRHLVRLLAPLLILLWVLAFVFYAVAWTLISLDHSLAKYSTLPVGIVIAATACKVPGISSIDYGQICPISSPADIVPPTKITVLDEDTIFKELGKIIVDEQFWAMAVKHGQYFEQSSLDIRRLRYSYEQLWSRWAFDLFAPTGSRPLIDSLREASDDLSQVSEELQGFNIYLGQQFKLISSFIITMRDELERGYLARYINSGRLVTRYITQADQAIREIDVLLEEIDKISILVVRADTHIKAVLRHIGNVNERVIYGWADQTKQWQGKWFIQRWYSGPSPAEPTALALLDNIAQASQAERVDLEGMKDFLRDKRREWQVFKSMLETYNLKSKTVSIQSHIEFLEVQYAYYVARVKVVNKMLADRTAETKLSNTRMIDPTAARNAVISSNIRTKPG